MRNKISALIAEGQGLVDAYQGPTAALLRELLVRWWDHMTQTQAGGICKVIIAEVRNFPDLAQFYTDEVVLPAHRLLAGALQRGIDRGEFRPVPVADAVHVLITPPLFLALHRHSIGACPVQGVALDERSVIETQVDLMLQGLQVRAPAGKGARP